MAALIDNRLDTAYESGSTTGNYALSSQWVTGSNSGQVSLLHWPEGSSYSPLVQPGFRVYFRAGADSGGGNTVLFALIRDLNNPGIDGPQWRLLPVTPGDRVRLSFVSGITGSSSAFGGVKLYARAWFTDANGTHLGTGNYFDTQTAQLPNISSATKPVEEFVGEAVVPDGAAYAYSTVYMAETTAGPTPNDVAVYFSDLYFGTASPARGGVADVSASTDARLGIVSDIYSRSREKIQLKLAGVDDLVRSGHRIELAAAAMTSTPAVWHWRQVTGPTVALNVRGNTCDFIAPDVERSTRIRIGVYAASEDGGNRSDWHYFDLDVEPPMLRFRGGDDGDFSPRSPYLVGYSRGKREIWNDVIRPATYEKNPRHELEVVDLGVPDDDVVFSTETPRRMAAGGVWVNPETGDVFRNFGAGYNETDDTTASPRTSTYWVNPANGDILEWIED